MFNDKELNELGELFEEDVRADGCTSLASLFKHLSSDLREKVIDEFCSDSFKNVYYDTKCKFKFEENDLVYVKCTGSQYTDYDKWFDVYLPNLKQDYMNLEKPYLRKANQFMIVKRGRHLSYDNNNLYAIEDFHGNVYLIHEDGLTKDFRGVK